jgi:hypothetical protein
LASVAAWWAACSGLTWCCRRSKTSKVRRQAAHVNLCGSHLAS